MIGGRHSPTIGIISHSRVNAVPTVVKAGVNFLICETFSHKYIVEKNAYCLEYSRNIYHKTYSEYFGAVIRLFLLSQLQDLQYCSDREPVSQPVSPSVYPFHLLIVLSYKQKLKKGFNYRIRRCKFYPC